MHWWHVFGVAQVPANSTLLFEVELVRVGSKAEENARLEAEEEIMLKRSQKRLKLAREGKLGGKGTKGEKRMVTSIAPPGPTYLASALFPRTRSALRSLRTAVRGALCFHSISRCCCRRRRRHLTIALRRRGMRSTRRPAGRRLCRCRCVSLQTALTSSAFGRGASSKRCPRACMLIS